MKKIILLLVAIVIANNLAFSQGTAINSTGTSADNSAMLDVSSTTQGVLIPRMTLAQRNSIPAPATSLLIYQTDGTVPGYYFNAGTGGSPQWVYVGSDNLGNHTASDSLNMSNKKIYNLATCTQNLDAANKLYVDSKVGAGGAGGGGSTGCSSCVTELSYKIYSGTGISWSACADSCYNLTYNGKTDWRMPSAEEIYYYRTTFAPPTGGWYSSLMWSAGPIFVHGSYLSSIAYVTESTGFLDCTADIGWGTKVCRCVR